MEHLGLAMHSEHERDLRQFAFNIADLVTLFVFVVLGANIPFDTLGEYFLPALAVLGDAAVPGAAADASSPAPFPTGAGPGPGPSWRSCAGRARPGSFRRRWSVCSPGWAYRISTFMPAVVAMAIVATLLLQALPAAWLAGRLGLLDGEPRSRAAAESGAS